MIEPNKCIFLDHTTKKCLLEKISLKLSEFYQLESELNGTVNPQTGEKLSSGLLSEKIKLTTKYWVNSQFFGHK